MSAPADVQAEAAQVARASYGRLLALLSSKTGDLIAAEEALAEAFLRALETWPTRGIPERPEAWLYAVARNKHVDGLRSSARHPSVSLDAVLEVGKEIEMADEIPDERLRLLFVCAHPAIDAGIRTPLMLQTVLGLEAAAIAKAFVVSPTAMAQRLVRAKRKIAAAAIPFVIPAKAVLAERLDSVLEAVYGVLSVHWLADAEQTLDVDPGRDALFLATLIAELLPREPEALGLAALVRYDQARRDARLTADGVLIPLDEQDTNAWDPELLRDADALLRHAQSCGRFGRFQLEAAIQSVHCDRRKHGETEWAALVQLYGGLLHIAPTLGAAVGRAAAIGRAVGPEAGLEALAAIQADHLERFQPAHATRAWCLHELGRTEEAAAAYDRAISLTTQIPMRAYLQRRRDGL